MLIVDKVIWWSAWPFVVLVALLLVSSLKISFSTAERYRNEGTRRPDPLFSSLCWTCYFAPEGPAGTFYFYGSAELEVVNRDQGEPSLLLLRRTLE